MENISDNNAQLDDSRRLEELLTALNLIISRETAPAEKSAQIHEVLHEMNKLSPAARLPTDAIRKYSSPLLARCTENGRQVLRLAALISASRNNLEIGPQDILDALSISEVSSVALKNKGYTAYSIVNNGQVIDELSTNDATILKSALIYKLVNEAAIEASLLGHRYVGSEHLLLAFVNLFPEMFSSRDEVTDEMRALLGYRDIKGSAQ